MKQILIICIIGICLECTFHMKLKYAAILHYSTIHIMLLLLPIDYIILAYCYIEIFVPTRLG